MSRHQPVGQVRFTNVAVVRLKRGGKRFEVAAYRNKVMNWRNKIETDLDEVLQIVSVFHNVGKGELAPMPDIEAAFGTRDVEEVCKVILAKGDLQVSDRERALMFDSMFKDIANLVCEMCVNPATQRPYPLSTIESAMRDTIHYSVHPNKAAKQQALDVIAQLRQHIPLERTKMHVRVTFPAQHALPVDELKAFSGVLSVQSTPNATTPSYEVILEPGSFRALAEFVRAKAEGSVEVVDFAVRHHTEADVETVAASAARLHFEEQQGGLAVPPPADGSGAGLASVMEDGHKHAENDGEEDEDADAEEGNTDSTDKHNNNNKKKKKKKKSKRRAQAIAQEQEQHRLDAASSESAPVSRRAAPKAADRGHAAPHGQHGDVSDNGERAPAAPAAPTADSASTDGLSCNTCKVAFGEDRPAHRQHFRSDLHRYNLKLKMVGLPHVSQTEYDGMDEAARDSVLNDWKAEG